MAFEANSRSLPASIMTKALETNDRHDIVVSISENGETRALTSQSCPPSPRDGKSSAESSAFLPQERELRRQKTSGLFVDPKVEDPDADVGGGNAEDIKRRKKILTKRRVTLLVLNAISLAAMAVGGYFITTQGSASKGLYFDWLIFFGGVVPFFTLSTIAMKYIFYAIEVVIYQEPLYHYQELKSSSRNLLFSAILLIWSFAVLSWIFCSSESTNGACTSGGYAQSAQTVQRILMCSTLACLASFLAALTSKLLSTHFLSNTYFKKLQAALEKEHLLKILSDPKARRGPQHKKRPSLSIGGSEHSKGKVNRNQSNQDLTSDASRTGSLHPAAYPKNKLSGIKTSSSADDVSRMGKDQGYSYDDLTTLPRGGGMTSLPESSRSTPNSSAPSSPRMSVHGSEASSSGPGEVRLKLDRELLDSLQMQMLKEEQDMSTMTDEEIKKLRTAVVIKTSASMMKQYKFSSEEEQREQLKRVKNFGKVLFYTIKGKDSYRHFITVSDVRLFFPDNHEGKKQAATAFSLFASDPKAKVTLHQIVDAVTAIYKDRGNIAASLTNTDSMVSSLRVSCAVALHFLFLGFYMLIWQIDLMAGFSAFSATVLALSFIFGNSIRNMFEAILFLFVVHPYDIGDWVQFHHDGEVIPYEVDQITLLHTRFRDNARQPTIMSNSSLFNKQIKNFTRSDDHLELLFVEVDFGMAQVVKEELKLRVLEMTKAQPSDYKTAPLWVVYVGVNANMKANLLVIYAYTCFPGDWDRKLPLRDRGIQVVTDVLAKHGQNGARYTFNHQMANGVPVGGLQQPPTADMQNLPPEIARAVAVQMQMQQQQQAVGQAPLLNNMV